MNPFVWCAVGAMAGWLAGAMMPAAAMTNRVENILVAVFGAFIGGEFLSSFVAGPAPAAAGLRPAAIGLALLGAVVMLVLLAVMRKAVGPMRPRKLRKKSRF